MRLGFEDPGAPTRVVSVVGRCLVFHRNRRPCVGDAGDPLLQSPAELFQRVDKLLLPIDDVAQLPDGVFLVGELHFDLFQSAIGQSGLLAVR